MQLYLNSEPLDTPSTTLEHFVTAHLQSALPSRIAIAVNGTVVPKTQWPSHTLNELDNVDAFFAVVGG
ncbi:sulfur carrier protein ThiS [Teredinibacter purpureus]|uniref:sulfur carrier protein ThiS n=1 Tax=Teredinibacter purpureus TaxID=2731756 RepID=UPI0005F8970E|nr:sulfur carrier protein ThiS [Teredinibacter purpureus]